MITKKDILLIADTFRQLKPVYLSDDYAQWRMDAIAIMETIAQGNPRFRPAEFIDLCGLPRCEVDLTGVCSICGNNYDKYGNNAEPVNNGRCCDTCNEQVVIPARLKNPQK